MTSLPEAIRTTSGFLPVWTYGWELSALVYPSDDIDTATYPYYDRWCDDWNVSTEGSTTDSSRSFAATAWLAETLWRDGDVAGARAQLAKVQEGHVPDDPPEEARVKSIARKIAAQMDKEGAK